MNQSFQMAETNFTDTDVNFKAIAVLLLGGIYYANLHTMYNGNIMCGLDIKSENGQNEIIKQSASSWAGLSKCNKEIIDVKYPRISRTI